MHVLPAVTQSGGIHVGQLRLVRITIDSADVIAVAGLDVVFTTVEKKMQPYAMHKVVVSLARKLVVRQKEICGRLV